MLMVFLVLFLLAQNPATLVVDGHLVVDVLPRDAIPAIDRPVFVSAGEADDFMSDDELVIGVVAGGVAKAYSTWLLDRHEIVNDVIGSTPIAVTWCPLCYTGIVYAREVDGRELTFGVSGRLWRENLVMYDRQSESFWSQAGGRAIAGPMKDSKLEMFPAEMMTWKQWWTLHPETLVLSKYVGGRLEGAADTYADYHRSSRIGVTRTLGFSDSGLGPKERVLSFVMDGQAFSVPLAELSDDPVVTIETASGPLLIVGTPDGRTARVFVTESREWSHFGEREGRTIIKDGELGSEWDGYTGRALAGPAEGRTLDQIPTTLSYWFAWKTFYPNTTIIRP